MKTSHLVGVALVAVCCALFLGSAMYAPGRDVATPVPVAAALAITDTATTARAGETESIPTASTRRLPTTTAATAPATSAASATTTTATVAAAAPTTAAASTITETPTTTAAPTTTETPTTTAASTITETPTTAPPTTTTAAAPPALPDDLVIQPSYRIVQAIGAVHVLDAPDGAALQTLGPKNELGEVTTLPVIEPVGWGQLEAESVAEAGEGPGWYMVGLRVRPNGSTGWVCSDEVTASAVTTAIVVQLAAHRLFLYDQGFQVADFPVGLGTATNPTPTGTFFVMGVDPHDPGSAYGPYAIGTSGLSETLTDWPGGGMIGIHGTNKPSSVGQNASHGCIRMHNSDVVRVAEAVQLGTPVFIVP